jgi:CDP-diacylglycerol--serine O-phosphatidyltransferase
MRYLSAIRRFYLQMPNFIELMKKHIPNTITLANLALGVLATLMALESQLHFASWLIIICAVLDFLDGFLAKLLNAHSSLGKQLDSLADLISFGMAPAFILYRLLAFSLNGDILQSGFVETGFLERLMLLSPVLIVLFSAMRLAQFNIAGEGRDFSGLPTPASALFIAGLNLYIIQNLDSGLTQFLLRSEALMIIILFLSLLMILPLPMFSFKFTHFKWRDNRIRYIFLALSCILLIILQEIALPLIILIYVVLSFSLFLLRKQP